MYKHRTTALILLVALSAFLVIVLYWQSLPSKQIKNGFTRSFIAEKLHLVRELSLNSSNYHFSGWIGNTCFISDTAVPGRILKIGEGKVDTVIVNVSKAKLIRYGEQHIDSPYFYVGDLDRHIIYRGLIGTWNITDEVHSNIFFTEFESGNGVDLFLRIFNDDRTAFRLSKESPEQVIINNDLLQKQVDGLFCTDGMLLFDGATQRVIYTYYYRNEFICADKDLHLLFRQHTIDTISHAQISVAHHSKEGSSYLSTPPFVVNRYTTVHDGSLYVNSKLRADNEDKDSFTASDVIDVYSLDGGRYENSFYLPRARGIKLRHFAVRDHYCYVLSENHFYQYTLAR